MDLDLSSRMSTWFYIDSNGREQGPFTSEEIVSWYQAGGLPTNFLLRRDIDSHFSRFDTFPRLFSCATFDAGLPTRIPSSVSSSPSLFGATYGANPEDHPRIPWMNRSAPGAGYRWPTREMQPAEGPWMNGGAPAGPGHRWPVRYIPPAKLPWMNGSSAGGAGYEWQEIELQPWRFPWMNGSAPAGAGHKWETREMIPAVNKEQNMLHSKHDPPQPYSEASPSELPKDINVDLLRKIKKAFNSTFRSGKNKEISQDETESFQKAKRGIKEEKMESSENDKLEMKEDLSAISRNVKVKIKKEYIEEEIKSEILESLNVDFMGMIKKDGNMNFCVNNAEEILKQETESFLIKESESHKVESPSNFKEIKDNTEAPRKGIKKPSKYVSFLVKGNGRRDRNVHNQHGNSKRKKVDHRPWKYRPKDNKIKEYKSISSSVTNKRPRSLSKNKSVSRYESDQRRKHKNKNHEGPFYEWICPRFNCGGIIMRRSVVCIACHRENPCVGVCQTEGCGQFNWISMMVCPKCHQDDGVP